MQGNTTYAVIETGGKQYRVTTGRQIQVDRLDVPAGNTVEFSNVLVVTDGGNTIIGNPTVDGAKVIATCLGEEKDDKVIVYKYKPKVRYRRKIGHRQLHTRVEIQDIIKPGGESAAKSRKKKAATGGDD